MNKLQLLLSQVNGASFISIDSETVPVLKGGKGNPMQGRVVKVSKGASVMVFQNKTSNAYENMVERRLIKEGKNPESFSLKPRTWGERIPATPFISHKGETYLEVIFLKEPKNVEYFLDGNPIQASEVIGLEKTPDRADSQGGLDDKVVLRVYKCNSIRAIRVDGIEAVRTSTHTW